MVLNTDVLLQTAINAAVNAGNAILKIYRQPFNVDLKEDRSPITDADRHAHEVISHELANTRIPVLSEEGRNCDYSERKFWELFWLVDPLDGTKEFVNRNGEFTVNIALIEKNIPVAGIIFIPVKDTLYFASEKGAFRIDDTSAKNLNLPLEEMGRFSVHLPEPITSERFRVVASRSHMNSETEEFIELQRKNHSDIEIVSAGSSLKFCMIAEGRADIYPRFGPTMEWDTAAGHAIVKYSGGKVLQQGNEIELSYNKQDLKNPNFISYR